MSDFEKPLHETVDERFTQIPALRRLVTISLCLPLIVASLALLQVLPGWFPKLFDIRAQIYCAMVALGGGFACGLASFCGAVLYNKMGLVASALFAMALNALGFFCLIIPSAAGP
ncbi:MAG TPA: hypothetical protein VG055_26090 [Planctomycetaceae bacterium]|jgi:hypothetical protein|nr:hypothetical protein [Planctomycetaceae bacterium]